MRLTHRTRRDRIFPIYLLFPAAHSPLIVSAWEENLIEILQSIIYYVACVTGKKLVYLNACIERVCVTARAQEIHVKIEPAHGGGVFPHFVFNGN